MLELSAILAQKTGQRVDEKNFRSIKKSECPKILVVEDDSVSRSYAELLLKHVGCEPTVFDNAYDALELLKRPDHTPFDLLLLDIGLPDLDGFTFAKQIRSLGGSFSRVPIVAVSANWDLARCLAAGMDDYIVKPLMQQKLMEVLRRLTGFVGVS